MSAIHLRRAGSAPTASRLSPLIRHATLVGRVGGPRASLITYLIPVVALALGAIFLSERVGPVVLAGAVLASRREHRARQPAAQPASSPSGSRQLGTSGAPPSRLRRYVAIALICSEVSEPLKSWE